ncbi:MAG: transporter [Inquilinaceae bacterium]
MSLGRLMRHAALASGIFLFPAMGLAQDAVPSLEARIAELERIIAQQQQILMRQNEELQLLSMRARGVTPPTAPAQGDGGQTIVTQTEQAQQLVQAEPTQASQPVGEPPSDDADTSPPEIQAIPELGGVLTPRGVMVLEPSIEYTQSAVNRFTFRGVEVVEAVLLGVIEATDADRDSITAAATARYGITDRLEVDVRVPYTYRNDRLTTLINPAETGDPVSVTDEVDAMGLGDIEAALHYQINNGRDGWPFFVANLRGKSTTGEGPFDVDRDSFGVQQELATGSGFYSIEPSITAIYPTDPAVFFANIGYTWNIKDDVDTFVGEAFIGEVDPGDTIGVSFGMGIGLNERASFTLGYQHDFVNGTETEINGVDFESESLDVGSLLFGMSYRLTDSLRLNVNTNIGVTEDAPDVQVTVRLPFRFQAF